jgi:hypothetical protein
VLIFGLSVPGSGCGRMTTHVPHLGHVTHEHTMRWAIWKLYGQRGLLSLSATRGDRQPAGFATDAEEELV